MNEEFARDTPRFARLLVDRVPAMLAYWDRELRCRFANRAYVAWFGVDPDALVGKSLMELLGPELFALNEPYIRAALSGQEQVFERMVPGPDGTGRHSLATYVPDIVDGEVVGFIAHVTDVTKLKEIEASLRSEIALRERAYELLRSSESSLREAQRLGKVGSWEWDVATDLTTWSEGLYRIFALDPESRPPKFDEPPARYEAASLARLQSAVANALRTGQPYTLELEYFRPDGERGWLEAHGEVVRDASGRISGLRGTVHEVTIRHEAEEARIRTKAIEAANRNKTELMSRVSHELRTPLNGILGFAQLTQADASIDAKHRQWAEVILGSGQHMLKLVDELLDLSAAELGQIVIRPAEFDLIALVQECVSQASEPARVAGLTLRVDAAGAARIGMRADPTRVKQVVSNLLSNAVKYTAAGGVVDIRLADRGTRVEVALQDTGIGLSPQQLDRIFLPFERLGAERTTVQGTGLGLALSKALTEAMGGSIHVASVSGIGSTFTVSLPKHAG